MKQLFTELKSAPSIVGPLRQDAGHPHGRHPPELLPGRPPARHRPCRRTSRCSGARRPPRSARPPRAGSKWMTGPALARGEEDPQHDHWATSPAPPGADAGLRHARRDHGPRVRRRLQVPAVAERGLRPVGDQPGEVHRLRRRAGHRRSGGWSVTCGTWATWRRRRPRPGQLLQRGGQQRRRPGALASPGVFNKWSNWMKSVGGQKSLQDFFSRSADLARQLFPAIARIGTALANVSAAAGARDPGRRHRAERARPGRRRHPPPDAAGGRGALVLSKAISR